MGKLKDYIRLMRVHHYIKNLLVFAALACSGELFRAGRFLPALAGFGAFCMTASAVYIINDIRDREKDRQHPVKCRRPIASGEIPVKSAGAFAALLLALAALCELPVSHPLSAGLLALYLLLNLAYSFGLKDVPLADVTVLVSGFLIRVVYGALVTGIGVSSWLYLTVVALSFYFALGKRRNERKRMGDGGGTRKVLRYYTADFLDKNMYMCLTLALVFYALWCVDAGTSARYGVSPSFTVPVVLLIMMRYSMDVEGNSDGDPVEVLLRDKPLLALCGGYLAVMFAILYFF